MNRIEIEARGLPTLARGDSAKLEVGEWVIAIGNPFGLEGGPSVTSGVISALDRSIQARNVRKAGDAAQGQDQV